MLTEDYVSYETAKLLKDKGFDETTVVLYAAGTVNESWYDDYRERMVCFKHNEGTLLIPVRQDDYSLDGPTISAPTLQMTMKWLRKVHKIDITIDPHDVENDWIYQFHLCQNKDYLFSRDVDTSYENCAEAAIKYCIENLI